MFPPTTESYVRAYAESTLDRHMGEIEEERAIREGRTYQEANRASRWLRAVGELFLALTRRLNRRAVAQATSSREAPLTVRPVPSTLSH